MTLNMPKKGNCAHCECFHPEVLQPGVGTCRAELPRTNMMMTPQGPAAMTFWPQVSKGDWCMRFTPRTEESPKLVDLKSAN